jgi:hypothetical protein
LPSAARAKLVAAAAVGVAPMLAENSRLFNLAVMTAPP